MAWVFVILLLIVLLVFGCTSSAQSYATAQQAQAQIEVAKIAQTQAWTNMISVLVLAALILLILFAIIALIVLAIRFMQVRAESEPVRLYRPRRAALPAEPPMLPSSRRNELIELDDITLEEIELAHQILDL